MLKFDKLILSNMKSVISIIAICILFTSIACNSSNGDKKLETNNESVIVKKTFLLDTTESAVSWVRSVDYKHMTKKVKVLGVYADVSMDNVQYETIGDLDPNSGSIYSEDDEFLSSELSIDLTLTRFYSEAEEQFFVDEIYPPAVLKMTGFKLDSADNYIVNAEFVMEESSVEIVFPASIVMCNDTCSLNARLKLNSSDLPILSQPKPENVNYDEIAFILNLVYILDKQ